MNETNVEEAIEAVNQIQQRISINSADSDQLTAIEEQLDYAEQLIADVRLDPQNIEERYRLQQATDLLIMLRQE